MVAVEEKPVLLKRLSMPVCSLQSVKLVWLPWGQHLLSHHSVKENRRKTRHITR